MKIFARARENQTTAAGAGAVRALDFCPGPRHSPALRASGLGGRVSPSGGSRRGLFLFCDDGRRISGWANRGAFHGCRSHPRGLAADCADGGFGLQPDGDCVCMAAEDRAGWGAEVLGFAIN